MNQEPVDILYVSGKPMIEHLPRTILPIFSSFCHFFFFFFQFYSSKWLWNKMAEYQKLRNIRYYCCQSEEAILILFWKKTANVTMEELMLVQPEVYNKHLNWGYRLIIFKFLDILDLFQTVSSKLISYFVM